MNKEILRKGGINSEEGIARLLGDEELYSQVLQFFLSDESFNNCRTAFNEKDYKKMFFAVHELKGVTGNASITLMFEECLTLTELLRNKEEFSENDQQAIEESFNRLKENYQLAIDAINNGI